MMTWRDVLLAGLSDARIQAYKELLEKALEEEGENRAAIEEDMNRAIQVNLEEYGEDFVGPTLAKLAEDVAQGLETCYFFGQSTNAFAPPPRS